VLSADVSVIISFVGFVWIFKEKIYPLLLQTLDEHIGSVQDKIDGVESLKSESSVALKKARLTKGSIAGVIHESRIASGAKIKRLRDENEEYLRTLKVRFEASLKTQLEAELAKQRDLLIERLADQIVEKLSEQVKSSRCEVSVNFAEEDLRKLNSL
jgi:F0F1-type ATP synthase membrane subunit b/b'